MVLVRAVAFLAFAVAIELVAGAPRIAHAYGYPIESGLLATIVGADSEDSIALDDDVPLKVRALEVFPKREVADLFAYRSQFRYSIAAHENPAPLVFVLAGTGSNFRASNVVALQRMLFAAGYHVVGISSTTHPDFMVSASRAAMPGRAATDARDLYETLQRVREDIADEVEVTGYSLTGFSLGATHCAFLAALDQEEGRFGFERVMMLNPSVDLFSSSQAVDDMVESGLPEGDASFQALVAGLLTEVSMYVNSRGREPLDGELLYRIAEMRIAEGRPPRDKDLQGIIGTVFRISSAGMIFTADALHGGGHVIPTGTPLTRTTPLTDAFERSARWTFARYLDEMLLPFWQAREPRLDRETLIAQASLRRIASFLSTAENVQVVTNEDDFILSDGDRAFLRETFGDRATIYPRGGHGGNLLYRENADHVIDFFKKTKRVAASATTASAGSPLVDVLGDVPAAKVADWGTAPPPLVAMDPSRETSMTRYDPIEKANRAIYRFNADFDRWIFLPVLKVWRAVLPGPVRKGLSNALSNLDGVTVLANSILQLSPEKSAGTLGRFLVNSTVGVAGLWDPASKIGLPLYDEDFGQTLGHWGVGPGPYLVFPVMGPSSLRDTFGSAADRSLLLFTLNAATDDWVDENQWIFIFDAVQARDDFAFRYDELGTPFEYDLIRYLYLEYRQLQVDF